MARNQTRTRAALTKVVMAMVLSLLVVGSGGTHLTPTFAVEGEEASAASTPASVSGVLEESESGITVEADAEDDQTSPPSSEVAVPVAPGAPSQQPSQDADLDADSDVAAAAATSVDLTAQLLVPPMDPKPGAGTSFEYSLVMGNTGVDAADGATFELKLALGVTNISAVCVGSTGGAACAEDIVITPGSATAHPVVRGTMPVLPYGSTTTVRVNGSFPSASSAEATLEVFPPAGAVDSDPASNVVTQSNALDNGAEVVLTKTQDKASVASGETRTYTVTIENKGPADLVDLPFTDTYSQRYLQDVKHSVSCDPSSTATCPKWADGVERGSKEYDNRFGGYHVSVASGEKLVLSIPVTTTVACLSGGSMNVSNTVSWGSIPGMQISGSLPQTVYGIVTAPSCPGAEVVVAKTQDKFSVTSGETRTYTVVVENKGPADLVDLGFTDQYHQAIGQDVKYSVSCDASSTAQCPSWADGVERSNENENFRIGGYKVSVASGKKLVLSIPVTTTVACLSGGVMRVFNTVERGSADGIEVSGTTSSTIVGEVTAPQCPAAEVVLTKTQDRDAVTSGESRTYTVKVENKGPADVVDLPFTDTYHQGTRHDVKYSVSCDASSTSACPTWADGVERTNDNYDVRMGGTRVSIESGKQLVLTMRVLTTFSECTGNGQTNVSNQVSRGDLKDVEVTGKNHTDVESTVTCADVVVGTRVPNDRPVPNSDVTVTTEVKNSVGTATNVPLTIVLPEHGLIIDESAPRIECVAVGKAVCPTDLRYDSATHSVVGTIDHMGSGDGIRVLVTGKAGVVPPKSASFVVTATAPAQGDVNPRSNTADATFGFRNDQTSVRVTQIIESVTPEDLTFTGSMECEIQGSFPVQVTVPKGADRATVLVTDKLWMHDSCVVTIDRPNPPAGYRWGEWSTDTTQKKTDIAAPWVLTFSLPLIQDPMPVPKAPAVIDPCDPGNATWDVPKNSVEVTWTLDADGQLTAHAMRGATFDTGETTHAFGLAEDSGVPCPDPKKPEPEKPGPKTPEPNKPEQQGPKPLAQTGSDGMLAGVLGGSLLFVAGATLVILRRKRRNA